MKLTMLVLEFCKINSQLKTNVARNRAAIGGFRVIWNYIILSDFRKLQSLQRIWILSSVLSPPFTTGIMWSKWIPSSLLQRTQRPPSLSSTRFLTPVGMLLNGLRSFWACCGRDSESNKKIKHKPNISTAPLFEIKKKYGVWRPSIYIRIPLL